MLEQSGCKTGSAALARVCVGVVGEGVEGVGVEVRVWR